MQLVKYGMEDVKASSGWYTIRRTPEEELIFQEKRKQVV